MGRPKKTNRRSKNKGKVSSVDWNFELDAGPGCHIARSDVPSNWLLAWETVDVSEFEGEDVPDLAVDTDEKTLSLCNLRGTLVVAYITVYETPLRGRDGRILPPGISVDANGTNETCTTLIVLCPPHTFAHLCYVELPGDSLESLRLDSDVQEWNQHDEPTDEHSRTVGFPLQGGPFRCTQGEGGQLTHFFAGNFHAIDFACPVGTPLLAVAAGVVVESKDDSNITGIAVSNLFEWNSILIKLDDSVDSVDVQDAIASQVTKVRSLDDTPVFVEYVHIEKSLVKEGDQVVSGQVIGRSGSVGFSPEPHLHFAAYRSQEPTAATVRVRFHSERDLSSTFLPRAGRWYDASGEVPAPGNVVTFS